MAGIAYGARGAGVPGAGLNGRVTHRLKRIELRGNGLLLRLWDAGSEADAAAYLRGFADPEFRRWNNPPGYVDDLDTARLAVRHRAKLWDEGTAGAFRVAEDDGEDDREDDGGAGAEAGRGTVLGNVTLNAPYWPNRSATVGYWVLPEARGRGVATRALRLVVDWAFGLGLHRIALDHAIGNVASCRVAERAGFAHEGTLRGAHRNADGTFQDSHLHGRLESDPVPTATAGR